MTMILAPTAQDVSGVAWPWCDRWEDSGQVVACFAPQRPGVVLSRVATYLGFAPLSDPEMATPESASLSWSGSRLQLNAFGQTLWSALALQSPGAQVLAQMDVAIVLVLDVPGGLGFRTFPRLPPEEILAGRFRFTHPERAAA